MHIKKLSQPESLVKPPHSEKIKSGFVLLHKDESVGEHVTVDREEVIYIIEGEALVDIEGEKEYVEQGSIIYVPKNKKHNITNENDEDLKYLYVVSLHV